jgi:molecular chaperone GrpE (heat shock protein)
MAEDTTKEEKGAGWRARLPRIFNESAPESESSEDASEGSDFAANGESKEFLQEQLQKMQSEMLRMSRLVESINERESSQEKVFNTLHSELRDYKNDFIYEHLKPIVRPLLFLYDSMEQFDGEVAEADKHHKGAEARVISPKLVRQNIQYFKDQLVEALRICEVTPMETPRGQFNPKLHKVIDVVPVKAELDGTIQRVIRSGWYINQQVLRSAEVIVGKKMSKEK